MDRIASEELEVGGRSVFAPQWKVLCMDAGKYIEILTRREENLGKSLC